MIRNNITYALYSGKKIDINFTSNKISKIFNFLLINRVALIYKDIIPSSKLSLFENNYLYRDIVNSEKKYHIRYLNHLNIMKEVSHEFQRNNIQHVFLKGSALKIDVYKNPAKRYTRDIDILVAKKNIKQAYLILRKKGFAYHSNKCTDSAQGSLNYSRHLPKMINKDMVCIEVHHRLTSKIDIKNCELANMMLKEKILFTYKDKSFWIPKPEHTFLHLCYHASSKNIRYIEPTFFYDVKKILEKYEINLSDIENDSRRIGLHKYFLNCIYAIRSLNSKETADVRIFRKNKNNDLKVFLFKIKMLFDLISCQKQIPIKEIRLVDVAGFLIDVFLKRLSP